MTKQKNMPAFMCYVCSQCFMPVALCPKQSKLLNFHPPKSSIMEKKPHSLPQNVPDFIDVKARTTIAKITSIHVLLQQIKKTSLKTQ